MKLMVMRSTLSVLVVGLVMSGSVFGQSTDAPTRESTLSPSDPDDKTSEPTAEVPQEVVLLLRSGREVTGFLVRDDTDVIVLEIQGIQTSFKKSSLRNMRVLPPLMERYSKMRSMLSPNDLNGRVLLAEWLRSRGQYAIALSEVESVLERDSLHPKAKLLEKWLKQQIELESRRVGREDSSKAGGPAKDRYASRLEAQRQFPLLKPEDINRIKVYEIDLKNPPKMVIERETIDQLIRENAESPLIPGTLEGRETFYRKEPEEILRLMFKLQARDLYSQVLVLDQPRAIRLFRSGVHGRWLINSCATTQCHGGQRAGRLWLFTDRPHSDETVYTNLVILDRYRLSDDTPLINYAQPAKSPLLQMGLPREISLYPHPDAPRTKGSRGWKPVFRRTDDRRFRAAVEWISSMYRPHPDYPIEYTPPVPKPEDEEPEADR
jgi:hypothetical protein